MKRSASLAILSVVALATALGVVRMGGQAPPARPSHQPATERADAALAQMPLSFIENRGQVSSEIDYYMHRTGTSVGFSSDGVLLSLPDRAGTAQRWGLEMDFLGAERVEPVGAARTPAVVSYFKGAPEDWRTGLPSYSRVAYEGLWPGVDLVYSGTPNRLKYSFLVHPGADPADIRLAWRGASSLAINEEGQLEVTTGAGSLVDDSPVSYQDVAGKRVAIPSAYEIQARNAYGFDVGPFDAARPLVIDPAVFLYAGYIGGGDTDDAEDIAVDGAGNAYVVGITSSSQASFPATVGPDLSQNGASDAFVAKVNPAGTGFVYAGYIGGSNSELGLGIDIDEAGNAYVTGRAESTESDSPPFPVTPGSFGPTSSGGDDAFVAKVNAAGTSLDYAGFLGGDMFDEGTGIAVDGSGNAYVTGETNSTEAGSPPFPVTPGSIDPSHNGDDDAFVAKVNAAGTALLYAGYLGGLNPDTGEGIDVNADGNAFVVGKTDSSETDTPPFPVTPGAFDPTLNSPSDGFVAKVNPSGSALLYATYIGADNNDVAQDVVADAAGNAIVAGGTCCAGFPATVGPDLTTDGTGEAFVAKLNPSGNALLFAGYIGGAGDERAEGVALDSAGNVYVTGRTWSTEATFPVLVGPDLSYNGGGDDAFLAKVNASGTAFVFAGYIGGAGDERGLGVGVDGAGNAFVAGFTYSSEATFPVTVGPDLTFAGSTIDGFVAKVETTEMCKGRFVTHLGGPGNDGLTGTSGADVVLSLAGNDTVKTLGGKDLVCAGDGNDKANGGGGKDKLYGELGKDTLNGRGGNDRLNGGPKKDTCIGGPGKRDKARGCEKEKSIP